VGHVATAQLVVDSDVIIDLLRQSAPTLRTALARLDCSITSISLHELLATPNLSGKQVTSLNYLLELMPVLSFDQTAAEKSSEVWRSLASRGQMNGLVDILSAGICLVNDLPLLTRNVEHFNRIDGLKLVTPDSLQSHIDAV
jgi:tRNA(fMet)-specific endonuclease VapC